MSTLLFETRQLAAFAALARAGSFTLAAAELFLTQSAISHAIKALEQEAGCRLVERAGRRVKLTPAGQVFLRHTERILEEMKAARRGLADLTQGGEGRLRVGTSTTACEYFLPPVLREFASSFPKCVVSIEPGDHARQVDLLVANRIDLALMLEPEGRKDIVFAPLFADELRFLVAPAHAWARAGRVQRDDFEDQTVILYHHTSHTFRLVKEYFREEGLPLTNTLELPSMEATKALVKAGVGVGVLANWVAQRELASGELVSLPLGKRRLRRQWGMGYLRGRRLSLAEESFVALCQSVTQQIAGSGETAVA